MPTFVFTAPDGKTYTVNGPEGATADQAFGILQQQLSAQAAAPAAQPPAAQLPAAEPARAEAQPAAEAQPGAAPKVFNAQDYLAAVEKRKEENPDRSAGDIAVDAGITFLKGVIGLPEAFVGLADIPTAGYIGKILESAGFKPKEAKAILDSYLSEAQQAANRKVREAEGFGGTVAAALQNPSVVATSIGESLPQMIGGAGVARKMLQYGSKAAGVGAGAVGPTLPGVLSRTVGEKIAPVVAAAAGEGLLGAGSAAEELRQDSKTGLLSGREIVSSIGSGVGTALFGLAGGRLAQKLGFDDIDTLLATGVSRGPAKSVGDFAKKAAASGVSEGLFEEMPQSAQEQMWMNYATGKPLMDGVPEAMGMGLVTGAAMGIGGVGAGSALNRLRRGRDGTAETGAPPERQEPTGLPGLQTPPAGPTAPAAPPTLEDQVNELLRTASTPPAAPGATATTAAEEAAQDQNALLEELRVIMGGEPRVEQVPTTPGETSGAQAPQAIEAEAQGQEAPAAAPASNIVERFPMGENVEYRVIETPTGYVASLYDIDAQTPVQDGVRIFTTQRFGDEARTAAIDFARSEYEKTPGAKKETAAPAVNQELENRFNAVVQSYRDAGMDENARLTEAGRNLGGTPVELTEQRVADAEQIASRLIRQNRLIQGAEAGTNEPVEPRLRTVANLYQTKYEDASGEVVPKDVQQMVLDKLNGYVKQLAEKGLHIDEVDNRFPTSLTDIRRQEHSLRGQFGRYAKQLMAVQKDYKRANFAQFEQAEQELGQMLGVDLREMREPTPKKPEQLLSEATDAELESAMKERSDSPVSQLYPGDIQAEIDRRKAKKQQAPSETQAKPQPKPPAKPQKEQAPSVEPEAAAKAKAQQDIEDALGDLGDILGKGTRLNIVPEQEQKLIPVLTRLMDAAFRMGYIKFKEAARYVMNLIRSKLGKEVADQVTIDHLQGAYIGMAGKYQDQGASSKKDVVSVDTISELEETTEEAPAEEAPAAKPGITDAKVVEQIRDRLIGGDGFKSIVEARKFIEELTGKKIEPGTTDAKVADEVVEAAVVMAAREIIQAGRAQGRSPQLIYDRLVDLYNRQPNLGVRTSTSVANQAYSTPAPLAFIASELAGITNDTTVYEPTAGNGMLVIGAAEGKLTLNELNDDRFAMLKQLFPNATVTQGNALESKVKPGSFDVVIENPPFGKVGDISNIDHDIANQSLLAMMPDGRAVLILGGVQATTEEGRREGYRGKAKREFYYDLYNNYNVVDHFTAGGNLYAKQGTTYPVDVIVIDGVGKSQRDLPAADLPQLITSYEQLKEKLNDRVVPGESQRPSGTDSGPGTGGETGGERVVPGAGGQGGESGTGGGRPTGGVQPGVSEDGAPAGGQPGTTGRGTSNVQPESTNVSEPVGGRGAVAGPGEQTTGERKVLPEGRGLGFLGGPSVVSGERVESGLKDRAGQETETSGQVTYNPHSGANSVGTLVPRAMADSIEQSLTRVEQAKGNLDDYVGAALEMDPETIRLLFSAEQVDALALAIMNAEEGKGFIIGDQTGVGKGRVVAGMIRYALINDKIPIFVTEKPNLYSDMIRDLDDIGMTDELAIDTAKPKILITNADEKIPYTLLRTVDGEITENELTLKAPMTGAALDNVFKKMQQADSLGDFRVIFTTYSQLQTVKGKMTERMRFVQQFGADNYMIFDESHNAGGAGEQQARTKEQREKAKNGESLVTGRASFVRGLVQRAFGTFFSSATYAKRPDVMDLYSSTDMKLAVDKISDLADAIKNGGIPMQQAVAKMLTQVGQYIRRERTFAGVSYNTQETKVDKETAENMATSMRDILAFSRMKETVVKGIQKEFDKQGAKLGEVGERTKVQSANFGSIMHNLIDQMLLSLKAQDSVDYAISRLKAGEKVVLTVSNTMGSFLKSYAEEMKISAGDRVDLSFADLYMRYLDKQRMITIKRPGGKKEEYRLTDEDLGPQLVAEYERIKEFIAGAGFGAAPISPIDYMHAQLRKAGYVTEEITGRNMVLDYESGTPVLSKRKSNIRQRVNAVKAFNNGDADVIILNQAGSTGLSLHASAKVKDQRKRHMIIVQPEKNIDTHMQMLGRIHRTGQVATGILDAVRKSIAARGRMLRAADRKITAAGDKKSLKLAENERNKILARIRQQIAEESEENIGTVGTYQGKKVIYGMPAYSQMMADIPAEMRPAAILLKKMASLNANTTASRKSAVTAEGAVDFMNDYGGQVAQEYLRDNPEVHKALGGDRVLSLAEDPTEGDEDDIRRLTGYIPILPIEQQEEIYKDLVDRYNELIEREDSMGTNKLESKATDLDAKTLESKQITEDKGDPSVFAQPAFMERVDVKRTVKPFSKQDVLQQIKDKLKGLTTPEFRNSILGNVRERAGEYGRNRVAEMQASAEPDPVAIEKFKNDLNAQNAHIRTVIDTYPIGTPVSIKNKNGVFVYGVVTNIESKGKTKNPVAGSDWKMTVALANGDAKSITVSFSQIGTTYTLARQDYDIQWLNPETLQAERIPLIDLFDKGSTVRREKRWMVTGNILAGYAAVNNMGQILTYTKEDGTTGQGILMPRTFDFEKQQKNAPVFLKSAAKVLAFFEKFGINSEVSTNSFAGNGQLTIKRTGYQSYRITVPSSKRLGGSYFLDKDLIERTGQFVKSGPVMSVTVYSESDLESTLQYIINQREEFFMAVSDKQEAREAFQTPLRNIEPSPEMLMQNPTEALVFDRKALIAKYKEMRQRRAAIMKRFQKGQAGLSEQREMQQLANELQQLKAEVDMTKPEKRSARDFFRKATDEWADGNISDDVYAVIETLYRKFPFVLEQLKLSVKQGGEGRISQVMGEFFAMGRLVRLYKGTNGVIDPMTARHEIVHSLEQMMSDEASMAVVDDWMKKLQQAASKDKTEAGQKFFAAVLEFINNPNEQTYDAAFDALPSMEYYQYLNPSEYWAVNAEKLMKRKLGSAWDRFVLAIKKMYEGLKSLIGFDNQYVIHRTFDDIMNARAERVTKRVLADYVGMVSIPLANIDNTRRNYKGGPAPLATWTSPNESRLDNFIYKYQDKHVDTKRMQEAVSNEIGDIQDGLDTYMKEELYHGRVAKQTQDFLKQEIQPLLKDMKGLGVTLDEFEEYLQNRAAPDRNALIATRNAQMPDGGSGIFNDEAAAYMANLDPEKKSSFEALALDIDKIVQGTQDLLVDTGLEKPEVIQKWRDTQPLYVPLNRDKDELDFVSSTSGMGRGYSTRGRFTKTATGSLKTVVDIFGNIALQRERAIVRAERARVGRALYGMAIASPNPDFWMAVNPSAIKSKKKLVQELINLGLTPDDADNIIQEPRVPRFDKQTGQITYEVNPNMRNSANVFAVRINGEDRFVFFNPGDPRALRMVEALTNMDADPLSGIMGTVAELTRTYAALNTQYNPVFGAWNFVRDTTAGAINLSGTPIAKRKLEVFRGAFSALRAIYRDLREKGSTTREMQEWIDLFERFQKAGGQTGYREQFSRSKEKATIIQRELKNLDAGTARKAAKAVFDWLSDYNDAMENAVRLSAFKAALDEGLTEERAASLAKNLTVNFNRKGQSGTWIGALYAFFNASVQGSARMAKLLVDRTPDGRYKLSKHGKRIIAGGIAIGVFQALALAMAGFDEDEPPEFLKNKNLIIPVPGGNYLIIPMPLGLNVFPNVGRTMTEFAMSSRKDAGKLMGQLFGIVIDSFNPLGSSGLAQTIAPTIIDPFIAVAENKDAFGRPISKEARATSPTPGYERSRESSTAFSQGMSYALNYMSGGGEYGIGLISPTADQIDYLIAQYTGGVGREVSKAARFLGSLGSEDETPPYKVPILGKLYGETTTPSAVTDKFYKNVTKLAEHEGTIKRMREDKVSPQEYKQDHPETRLINRANRLENQISQLNRTIKDLQDKPETDFTKDRIKRLKEQKNRMMTRFNEDMSTATQ
jgi:hypothetical protein